MAMKQRRLLSRLLIAVCALVAVAFVIHMFSSAMRLSRRAIPARPMEVAQSDFVREYELLNIVKNYLIASDIGRVTRTSDAEVQNAARTLSRRGFQRMERSGNAVVFTRWTRFRDLSIGIVYVHDTDAIAIDRHAIAFLTLLVPLDSQNGGRWYYYEADFNVYRMRGN